MQLRAYKELLVKAECLSIQMDRQPSEETLEELKQAVQQLKQMRG